MKWYTKQLKEKLKKIEDNKKESKKQTSKKSVILNFDLVKLKIGKKNFSNPVAAMNRNRKKTDIF